MFRKNEWMFRISSGCSQSNLVYEEKPIAVVDRKERVTRNRVVKFYKVLWSNYGEEDATWETLDYLKEVYKIFFENQ